MSKVFEKRIREAFTNSSYYALRKISCEIRGETVELRGKVPSYYLKQMAQAVVLKSHPNATRIENRLEVLV